MERLIKKVKVLCIWFGNSNPSVKPGSEISNAINEETYITNERSSDMHLNQIIHPQSFP